MPKQHSSNIKLAQEEGSEVPVKILATAILKISESLKRLEASGLNRRAIIALVHDDISLSKTTIRNVLDSLSQLADKYTAPQKRKK